MTRAVAGDRYAIEGMGRELVDRFRAQGAKLTEDMGQITEWFSTLPTRDRRH